MRGVKARSHTKNRLLLGADFLWFAEKMKIWSANLRKARQKATKSVKDDVMEMA